TSPANFTLNTLGDHTLSVTVKKTGYKDKTFSKVIKIVEELQEPTIKIWNGTSYIPDTDDAEDTTYSSSNGYGCYNVSLTTSGTLGTVSCEGVASGTGESVSVNVDGSSSSSLSLGPHTVMFTVKKEGYIDRTFTKKVYIQGELQPPTIQYSIKKSGNTPQWTNISKSNSIQDLKFSYISYDKMPIKVTAGNNGNNIQVAVKLGNNCIASANVTDSYTNDLDISNTAYTITVNQSRQYCKSSTEETRKFKVNIKPVTLTYQAGKFGDDLQVNVQGFGGDSGDMNIRGEIYIYGVKGENNKCIWHFQGANKTVTRDKWCTINDTDAGYNYWSDTFSSPSDKVHVCFYEFRRDIDNKNDIHFSGDHDTHNFPEISISDIKKGKGESANAGTGWTYICNRANRSGDEACPRIRFTPSD
ncbi:MAG: hypothetical protein IIT39_00635, partial [Clostridia bacterium]|nr:hypothetical protein [Clostridia bacterium]